MHLVADCGAEELGRVVEAVHVPGVSDVLLPVLDWALAGLEGLHTNRSPSVQRAHTQRLPEQR